MATFSKREMLLAPCAALGMGMAARAQGMTGAASQDRRLDVAPGRFEPTVESLKTYRTPDWFRDAKLGIWAHWGPQAVPRQGDWYARFMYVPGHPHYEHHLKTYGHPSEVRLQGYRPALESREVRSGSADGQICRGRREILRVHGRASRQFRLVEFEAPSLERRHYGAETRYRRRLEGGGQAPGAALRRVRASGRELHLVVSEPSLRPVLAEARRAL